MFANNRACKNTELMQENPHYSVESFWVGTLDDEHGDYGRCGLRKTPPKPFIFVSKKVLIQRNRVDHISVCALLTQSTSALDLFIITMPCNPSSASN